MASERNPSGLPGEPAPGAKNRFSQAMDWRPTAGTAAAGFAAYIFGAFLLMASMWVLIAGLVMVVGSMGTGVAGRVTGVALLVVGGAAFTVGRWFCDEYRVQRHH